MNGKEVTAADLPIDEARVEALAEVRIRAAYHGRPVRALAKEPDGSAWPLIVDVDGSVTILDRPHPVEVPAPIPAAPAPAPVRAAPVPAPTPPAPALVPAVPAPAPPAPVPARPAPAPASPAPAPAHLVPPPAAPAGPSGDWTADLPPALSSAWAQLITQERAGHLAEAILAAEHLEHALAQHYSPDHVAPVHVLTFRAWLTLRLGDSWAEITALLVEAVQRRQGAPVPQDETDRLARNAHAAWRRLTAEDPDYAREIASDVMELLDPDDKRSHDIVRWLGAPN
ncbi:hypothetical protein [Streptomyces hydrogenans]|uniref:hypothetical protein n=1 Tax=Streptomyces hydrogenans TaxID=1873719 RepID=UPI00331A4967